MDFTGDAKMAMFGYELGVQAASQPKLIGWQPGDEFDAIREAEPTADSTAGTEEESPRKGRKF